MKYFTVLIKSLKKTAKRLCTFLEKAHSFLEKAELSFTYKFFGETAD